MSKVVWIVMGLIVAVMAVGFASQRHLFDTAPRTRIITPSAERMAAPPVASAPTATTRRTGEATATAAKTRVSWKTFDTAVNLLNVVVGIVGIWMTVHGMRMQRMALAADEERQGRRRRAA